MKTWSKSVIRLVDSSKNEKTSAIGGMIDRPWTEFSKNWTKTSQWILDTAEAEIYVNHYIVQCTFKQINLIFKVINIILYIIYISFSNHYPYSSFPKIVRLNKKISKAMALRKFENYCKRKWPRYDLEKFWKATKAKVIQIWPWEILKIIESESDRG